MLISQHEDCDAFSSNKNENTIVAVLNIQCDTSLLEFKIEEWKLANVGYYRYHTLQQAKQIVG